MAGIADEIFTIFERNGVLAYFGEPVSVTGHALQTAHAGVRAGGAPALILAALLHDIGHLIEPVPDDIAEWTVDARHEISGSRWLAQRFPASVSEPVRLHVPAKRYLCAVDADYFDALSSASVHTLRLQGGPMTAPEIVAFEAEPFCQDAVRLRRWDDAGKAADGGPPPFAGYRDLIESLALWP